MIAQGCQVVANGDLGYEVVEALEHDRIEPPNEMHWWYSKEAYFLVYQPKIQPIRGEKLWKIDPS
ncbi:hypothetical protein RDI58_007616 [Solanum bulbocastanum]|uniref:Uncharacterized protein n=1 Tax=Solanum bulbocastanum TaxID=147425 RepID=A0AAN8TT59_SOLBU